MGVDFGRRRINSRKKKEKKKKKKKRKFTFSTNGQKRTPFRFDEFFFLCKVINY
jgi:hypothetical protein